MNKVCRGKNSNTTYLLPTLFELLSLHVLPFINRFTTCPRPPVGIPWPLVAPQNSAAPITIIKEKCFQIRQILPFICSILFYLLRKEREDFLCNVEPTRTSLVVIRVLKVTSRTQMKECVCVSRVCLEEGALKNYYSAIDRRLNLLSNGESSFQTPFEA